MNKNSFLMTTAQFAKLHHVNKRTLHYYDSIGLFSPKHKGENGYRYYDSSQSVDFEYLIMLKELDMSLEEIKQYINTPNSEAFIEISDNKLKEIDKKIKELKHTKALLLRKREQLFICEDVKDIKIQIENYKSAEFMTLPYNFETDNIQDLFSYISKKWGIKQCRDSIGSYISLEKIINHDFTNYDGLFTPVNKTPKAGNNKDILHRLEGQYLCGYIKGNWSRLSKLYEEMLKYAKTRRIKLTGFAYEQGLNDFLITDENDCVTQVIIKIKD